MPTTEQNELTETNRSIAWEMYTAVGNGDVEKFFTFVSPDIVVEEPRFLPYGGTYRGFEGLTTLFGKFAGTFVLEGLIIDQITVDGESVVAFCRIPLKGTDETVVFAERVRIENGKAVSLHLYMHDAAALVS
jgi:ketosteroid isomerase-like protein